MKSTGIRSRYVRSGVRVFARDDGRFANSTLKQWLDQLASGKGLCCSFTSAICLLWAVSGPNPDIEFGIDRPLRTRAIRPDEFLLLGK